MTEDDAPTGPGAHPRPDQEGPVPRFHPMPPPGSTRTIGGNIQSSREDRVDPEIAGGPDHGGPR